MDAGLPGNGNQGVAIAGNCRQLPASCHWQLPLANCHCIHTQITDLRIPPDPSDPLGLTDRPGGREGAAREGARRGVGRAERGHRRDQEGHRGRVPKFRSSNLEFQRRYLN